MKKVTFTLIILVASLVMPANAGIDIEISLVYSEQTYSRFDVNRDGLINPDDANLWLTWFLSLDEYDPVPSPLDVSNDGVVSILDLNDLLNCLLYKYTPDEKPTELELTPYVGKLEDLNNNGKINSTDLSLIMDYIFNNASGCYYDINDDGFCNWWDYVIFYLLLQGENIGADLVESAKITFITPNDEFSINLPDADFAVADYTSVGQISSLKIKSFEIIAGLGLNNATLVAALYKKGLSAQEWKEYPLNFLGANESPLNIYTGTWILDINEDLTAICDTPGEYVLELYLKGNWDTTDQPVFFNNKNEKYKMIFCLGSNSGSITGDVDGSGVVDVEDVNATINIILRMKTAEDYPGNADMDGNGIIDVEDVNAMINIILKI